MKDKRTGMKIALAQMKMSPDIRENYQKSLRFIREAAGKGADLVCFPEVQLTPFFPQYPDRDAAGYVITEGSEYVRGVREACAAFHIFASPNFYMEEGGRRYDMSLLIDDHGEIIGRQKMVHIAQCDQFYEQSYYTPSEEEFRLASIECSSGSYRLSLFWMSSWAESSAALHLCSRSLKVKC